MLVADTLQSAVLHKCAAASSCTACTTTRSASTAVDPEQRDDFLQRPLLRFFYLLLRLYFAVGMSTLPRTSGTASTTDPTISIAAASTGKRSHHRLKHASSSFVATVKPPPSLRERA